MEKALPEWRQFENIVRKILTLAGYDLLANEFSGSVGGFDFSATHSGEQWAIEVKHYRTPRAQPSLIEAAAARLVNRAGDAQDWRAMLVVSCHLPPELRAALEAKYLIQYVDRNDLRTWASAEPTLLEELETLVQVESRETLVRQVS
jgi:Holliday junction resolvase-like predicted endonuclease